MSLIAPTAVTVIIRLVIAGILLASVVWLCTSAFYPLVRCTVLSFSCIALGIIGYLIYPTIWNPVTISPSGEMTLISHTTKPITLTVFNGNDFTIFDMCVYICVSDATLALHVHPIEKDTMAGLSRDISGIVTVLSNKCITLSFGSAAGLSPHTSRTYFNVEADGNNIINDAKIDIGINYWSKRSSLFKFFMTKKREQSLPQFEILTDKQLIESFKSNPSESRDEGAKDAENFNSFSGLSFIPPINKYCPHETIHWVSAKLF